MMRRGASVWLTIGAMAIACHDAPERPDAAPNPPTPCATIARVRVTIEGSYSVNPTWPSRPMVVVAAPGLEPPPTLQLPEHPSVAASPAELCTSRADDRSVTVTCLGDDGAPHTLDVTAADIAQRLEVEARCVALVNEVAEHDLEAVRARWATTVAADGCAADAAARVVRGTLALRPPPRGLPYRIAAPEGEALGCVMARLAIPALGVSRELGCVWNHAGPCWAAHLRDRPGVRYACSDDTTSSVYAYQVGRTLFVSPAVREDDAGAPTADDGRVQSLELPCGARAEFDVTSFEKLQWECCCAHKRQFLDVRRDFLDAERNPRRGWRILRVG